MPPFGSIVKIPATDRLGVVSGLLNINNCSTMIIYPISTCVYLSSNQDFICTSTILFDLIMVETWNPILIMSKQDLQIVDTISKESLQLYEKFLYSVLLSVPFEERKLFTGPPITATSDVRHLFQKQERKPFEFLLRPFKHLLVTLLSPTTL